MSMIKAERAKEYLEQQNKLKALERRAKKLEELISTGQELSLCVKRDRCSVDSCSFDHYMDGHTFSFKADTHTIGFLLDRAKLEIQATKDIITNIEFGR